MYDWKESVSVHILVYSVFLSPFPQAQVRVSQIQQQQAIGAPGAPSAPVHAPQVNLDICFINQPKVKLHMTHCVVIQTFLLISGIFYPTILPQLSKCLKFEAIQEDQTDQMICI